MKKIHQIYLRIEPHIRAGLAAHLLLAVIFSSIPFPKASAVQITNRSIVMSDSGASGGAITSGVGAGTNVAYTVNFTPSTTAIGGIVIDFCANSALAGDTCNTSLNGFGAFNVNRASLSISGQTNLGAGPFTVATTDAQNNRVILTRTSPAAPTGAAVVQLGNGTTNGFTNPSANGSFYARIYTYATSAAALAHNTTNPTGYVDNGGVALAIASVIQITARVQETITFCVFAGATPAANCVAAGGSVAPALEIGHGTTKKVIDATAVDTVTAFMQLSTNAGFGADIRMHSSSTNGGLDGPGSNYIPPVGSGAATPSAIANGTAAFGLRVNDPGSQLGGAVGTIASDAGYYNSAQPTYYGMDSVSSENVKTTFGDIIASANAPVSNISKVLTFGATASNLTPAGLYSANLSLVATGKF